MSSPRLTLLTGSRNYSSWSLRAWLALRLSGLPFQERRFDLRGPERAKIASASPSGMVPCLLVPRPDASDLAVWDSLAICEYLAERAPEARLWPQDPDLRAWARSIVAEMHAGFAELRRVCPMDAIRTVPDHAFTPEAENQIRRIERIWTECRMAHASKGDFLFGSFSIADCFYAPVVSRFATYKVAVNPAAQAYADAIWSWAAMREWVAGADREERARARAA
jgi:glutathione S-transferase